MQLSRLSEYLARPGCPAYYSAYRTARVLDVSEDHVRRLIHRKKIRCGRRSGTTNRRGYMIPRSEVLRLAREINADRPIKLARILCNSQPEGRILVVTADRALRTFLSPYRPLYCSSLFALGQMLYVHAAWAVVVDMDVNGSSASREAAERIASCPDRPFLIGILPEHIKYLMTPPWDAIVDRPFGTRRIQRAIAQFRK